MKLSHEPISTTAASMNVADALARWYARHPTVFRLWGIQPASVTPDQVSHLLRVIVMLEPSLDGDETGPAWMARGSGWQRELRLSLGDGVQLERIDAPLSDEIEIDGEGTVLCALSWRDPTAGDAMHV